MKINTIVILSEPFDFAQGKLRESKDLFKDPSTTLGMTDTSRVTKQNVILSEGGESKDLVKMHRQTLLRAQYFLRLRRLILPGFRSLRTSCPHATFPTSCGSLPLTRPRNDDSFNSVIPETGSAVIRDPDRTSVVQLDYGLGFVSMSRSTECIHALESMAGMT